MTENVAQRSVQPSTEAQNSLVSAQLSKSAAKDISLVTLVPKWGGMDKSIPLVEFLEAIDATASIGNWTDADKIQVCVPTTHAISIVQPPNSNVELNIVETI